MSNLKIWSNGTEIIIAESEQQAKDILLEMSGPMDEEELDGEGWYSYDDDETFVLSEETDTPPYVITKNRKAKEWCKEAGKPSYFASTEW